MVGDYVVLRCWRDTPAVARVYEEMPEVVSVLSPEHFDTGDLIPIGFRKTDVFKYDEIAQSELSRGMIQWEKMTLFAP